MGSIAAEMFDEIIIRQDKRLRGKTEKELIEMLHDGIKMKDPNKKTTIIPSEKEAITYAVKNAVKDHSLFCVVMSYQMLWLWFKNLKNRSHEEN